MLTGDRPVKLAELHADVPERVPSRHMGSNGQAAAHVAAPTPQSRVPAPARAEAPQEGTERGFNLAFFEGRLAEDPVVRESENGRTWCRVAIIQQQPDQNGQPGTQGVDIVMFDERARNFAKKFRKGDSAVFIGRETISKRYDRQGRFHLNISLHVERIIGYRPVLRDVDVIRWLRSHGYEIPTDLAKAEAMRP